MLTIVLGLMILLAGCGKKSTGPTEDSEYTDPVIRRAVWTLGSAPAGKELSQRCKMWWYNPYDQVLVKEIWPGLLPETSEEKTDVLHLQFFPGEPHRPSNLDFDPGQPQESWNSIMRARDLEEYDQTGAELLELWVSGGIGILHIDLGRISEDVDGDHILDTEDKPRDGARDGVLDDDEDLGLDTLTNDQERAFYNSTLNDPAGDDWSYDNKYDYSCINGTEGNRNDPERGRQPDTEDLGGNALLDITVAYFQFTVDLSKDEFLADLSYPSDSTNWRLYRIPVKDPKNYLQVGDADWDDVRFVRIWVSCEEECLVEMASFKLLDRGGD
jgi:cell surface protein SprA